VVEISGARHRSVELTATASALKLLVGEEGCILADLLSLKLLERGLCCVKCDLF